MNLLKSEEHNLLVRAALIEGGGNVGLTLSTLERNGLLLPNGAPNRAKIMAIVRKNPYKLRTLPGIGRAAYADIIRMMLETV